MLYVTVYILITKNHDSVAKQKKIACLSNSNLRFFSPKIFLPRPRKYLSSESNFAENKVTQINDINATILPVAPEDIESISL